MATIKHQAARAAFGAAADVTLKYLNKDPEKREKSLLKIVDFLNLEPYQNLFGRNSRI